MELEAQRKDEEKQEQVTKEPKRFKTQKNGTGIFFISGGTVRFWGTGSLDSSLCFIQSSISYDVLCI